MLLVQLPPDLGYDPAGCATSWGSARRAAGTTSFVYARLHGPARNSLYAGSYSDAEYVGGQAVREWAAQERDVFVYFNDDSNGQAVGNAATLGALLGV